MSHISQTRSKNFKKNMVAIFKKLIRVKDTLPLIPTLRILPLASNILIPSFLPPAVAILEVAFYECL